MTAGNNYSILEKGLSNEEVQKKQLQYGRNVVEEKRQNKFFIFLRKFWAPVPWMLEITIILQITLGKTNEAIIIAALLLFNSVLAFFQEEHANKSLTLLRHHLAIQARVLRNEHWQLISAEDLVPDDIVHLRMGDISPADIHLLDGQVLIDQSILTGEALPIESEIGTMIYSGAIIKRGEATGKIIATGKNTFFGKSIELVQLAKTESHIKNIIFIIVKYLVTLDIVLSLCVLIFAYVTHLPLTEVLPFILILLVASVPIALPATFTLATAIGAMQLAKQGVLVTRLSAVEEAARMDVLCLDKTGTITQNQLTLAALQSFSPYSDKQLLYYAALASDDASQDPIDKAILLATQAQNLSISEVEKINFIPFDPAYKRTEVCIKQDNQDIRILKGAPNIISDLTATIPSLSDSISEMASFGYRILAVAISSPTNQKKLNFVGLIGFSDPPRDDSKLLLNELKKFGLKICMVTGDGASTARTISNLVGISDNMCSPEKLEKMEHNELLNCDIFAGMFPDNKFQLVKIFQRHHHVVGMTGDGVNDAPALKQAEVGIAVSNATDVAKSASSLVLTEPGLSGVHHAIEISRCIYQRMLTYTLNKIVKSFVIAIFLSLGVILTGKLIITPLLIVLLLFANDFVTMSIATDNVSYSNKPTQWKIANLMLSGGIVALFIILLSFAVFYYAYLVLHLTLPQLQTLIFLLMVFTGQGTVYLLRERKHFWHSLPSRWLMLSSLLDIIIVSVLASQGILMAAIDPMLIAELLILVIVYLFMIDFIKIPIFSYFKLD